VGVAVTAAGAMISMPLRDEVDQLVSKLED
jgi:hypothetical protein